MFCRFGCNTNTITIILFSFICLLTPATFICILSRYCYHLHLVYPQRFFSRIDTINTSVLAVFYLSDIFSSQRKLDSLFFSLNGPTYSISNISFLFVIQLKLFSLKVFFCLFFSFYLTVILKLLFIKKPFF